MRKNSARKWLHATLDLLPVVIIPIFALYATNKNATFSQEITVSQNKVVNFNQLSEINQFEFNAIEEHEEFFLNNNITFYFDNVYLLELTQSSTYVSVTRNMPILAQGSDWYSLAQFSTVVEGNYQLVGDLNANLTSGNYYSIFEINSEISGTLFYWVNEGNVDNQYYHVNLFNLTQMFGSGNEPTYNQFLNYYPLKDYSYTLSEKQLLKDYDQITYNDTDIGSQFMYGLYNSVDKYFNIGNVFNLGSIYDWLNLNIFNGNSPIAIYIVWNIVAYEFLMDLLFLLYGLFMFFIDTCTNLMDRFYCNLSGRR